jgi:hypothetical protein
MPQYMKRCNLIFINYLYGFKFIYCIFLMNIILGKPVIFYTVVQCFYGNCKNYRAQKNYTQFYQHE